MKLHGKAALTVKQRQEVKRLRDKGASYRSLARRFGVQVTTIWRWAHRDSPLDLSTAPRRVRKALSQEQTDAIRAYRHDNSQAGARTIASSLSRTHGLMSHATISRFLQREGLTHPPVKSRKEGKPLTVGRHRLQMDIQQLPAIEGGEKFEYKVTIIHMATRMKYSNIYPTMSADVVVQALEESLAHLPPFFFSVDR
jgi:transposase